MTTPTAAPTVGNAAADYVIQNEKKILNERVIELEMKLENLKRESEKLRENLTTERGMYTVFTISYSSLIFV